MRLDLAPNWLQRIVYEMTLHPRPASPGSTTAVETDHPPIELLPRGVHAPHAAPPSIRVNADTAEFVPRQRTSGREGGSDEVRQHRHDDERKPSDHRCHGCHNSAAAFPPAPFLRPPLHCYSLCWRRLIARCASRSSCFSRRAWRLSHSCLPLPTAISSFARPSTK